MGLTQFLNDDLRGSHGVQKPVAQDLANDLIGPAVIALWTGCLGLERDHAPLLVSVEELIIALAAIAEFFGDHGNIGIQTLTLDEHEEPGGHQVGGIDWEIASRASELEGFQIKLEGSIHEERMKDGGIDV